MNKLRLQWKYINLIDTSFQLQGNLSTLFFFTCFAFSENSIFFNLLDAHHWSKYLFMTYSTLIFIASTPLLIGIVRFESQFHNRLLNNRELSLSFEFLELDVKYFSL